MARFFKRRSWFFVALTPLVFLGALSAWLLTTGASGRISMENFNRIHEGMTINEVNELIGRELESPEIGIIDGHREQIGGTYSQPGFFPGPEIYVQYENGRLTYKDFREPDASEILDKMLVTVRIRKPVLPIPAAPMPSAFAPATTPDLCTQPGTVPQPP
jgi:hypothetical protein